MNSDKQHRCSPRRYGYRAKRPWSAIPGDGRPGWNSKITVGALPTGTNLRQSAQLMVALAGKGPDVADSLTRLPPQ